MAQDLVEREIRLPGDKRKIYEFLQHFDLKFSENLDCTLAWLDRKDNVVATGSLKDDILRNIAVDKRFQGEGLLATVVSRLIQEAVERGQFHYFVYTKPDTATQFEFLGFQTIGRANPYAVLLESGFPSIGKYKEELLKAVGQNNGESRAGLVMNCNPFTWGHRYLIEKASMENDSVIVFVVSEDVSEFPAKDRLELVLRGTADLRNVTVVDGGRYIISGATFPAYFTKGTETALAQAALDLNIFAQHIAPAAGITVRYVGEEPYSEITNLYNSVMLEQLPQYGIPVVVVPRFTAAGEIVSASKVRSALQNHDWGLVKKLVPETTLDYLLRQAQS